MPVLVNQEVKGKSLSPEGQPIGGEFSVSSAYTSNPQPVVLENGNILVSWRDQDTDTLDRRREFFAGDGSHALRNLD